LAPGGSLVFGAVVAESACIGAMGALAGFGVYIVLFAAVARVIRAQTGVVLSLSELHPVLVLAPAGLVALCALGRDRSGDEGLPPAGRGEPRAGVLIRSGPWGQTPFDESRACDTLGR
jgi:hypothetical protein